MKKRKKKNYKYLLIVIIFGLIYLFFSFKMNNNFKELTANILNIYDYKEDRFIDIENKELNNEIRKLKDFNKLDSLLTDKTVINASVIKRSTPYWHNYITIDKGSKQGIKKGYAVLNNGLAGEVIKVNNNNSEVKLITSSDNNSISAKLYFNDKEYFGIIKKYNTIKNELYLENVIGDLSNEIIGLDILTSGLSSNMPSGLIIGKIKSIKKDNYNLSNTITINLESDLNNLSLVKVVGKK